MRIISNFFVMLKMGTILKELTNKKSWCDFLDNRIQSGHLSEEKLQELMEFISKEQYKEIAEGILKHEYSFSIPVMSKISKSDSERKRIVYRYESDEVWVLKCLAFLMHKYDERYSDRCYSFRRDRNAKNAIYDVLSTPGIDNKYCLRIDISNYFNSIPVDKMCQKVREFIDDDNELADFLTELLSVNKAVDSASGEEITGERGVMAGTPISTFLANMYMEDLDRKFESCPDVVYMRYADDIILLVDSSEKVEYYTKIITAEIEAKGLKMNMDKYAVIEPGKSWEFLGIKYCNGVIDISDNTKHKIKTKIKRKAHSLYRWRNKKGTTFEQTAHVMIRCFNCKFYDVTESGDFSWSKWFFPLINTSRSLKEIDGYLIQYIRFLDKGRHYKGNYRVQYSLIKELGFRSLVHEYYMN